MRRLRVQVPSSTPQIGRQGPIFLFTAQIKPMYKVEAFNPGKRSDFFDFHTRIGGECFCTAWWVDSWEEWQKQSPQENLKLRENLMDQGEYDGFLIYEDSIVIGWCQGGSRDRFGKLLSQFQLTIDPKTWAISCIRIDPAYQGKGVASFLISAVLEKLRHKGITRVEAYPKIDISLPGHQQWTGPRRLYENAGFKLIRKNNTRSVYAIDLMATPLSEIPK